MPHAEDSQNLDVKPDLCFLTCLSTSYPTSPAISVISLSHIKLDISITDLLITLTLPMSKCSLMLVWVLQEADTT